MRLLVLCTLLLAALPLLARAQHGGRAGDGQAAAPPPLPDDAYRVYAADGTPATLDDVVAAMDTAAVVLVGERHDDPTAHAVQDRLLRRAFARYAAADSAARAPRPLALSMEMFERDVQAVVDEYLAGLISERHFTTDARAWSNYGDYRPLVAFAKAHGVPVLAANAPRRYVNRVGRMGRAGLDGLPMHARSWLPPQPYPGPTEAYRAKWNDLMMASMPAGPHGSSSDAGEAQAPPDAGRDEDGEETPDEGETPDADAASPHGGGMTMGTMLQAQALWDATMAYTIAEHLLRAPDALVIHLTGGFHMTRDTGTPDALRHYRPSLAQLTVATEPVADVTAFDADAHTGLGDFVILTAADRLPPRQGPMMGGEAESR